MDRRGGGGLRRCGNHAVKFSMHIVLQDPQNMFPGSIVLIPVVRVCVQKIIRRATRPWLVLRHGNPPSHQMPLGSFMTEMTSERNIRTPFAVLLQ
jgi:hypothetical protein